MELKVNEVSIPEQITFNYDELKRDLIDKVSTYETLVYTDDQIKQAKADKANLNKLKKALNDERIRREKEYMKPFNDFKSKINEIICIIDKPVAVIDRQVKEYEDKVAQFQLGYKGYIQLAIRSGQYKKLNVLAIKEGELEYFDPMNEEIQVSLMVNKWNEREALPTVGYYAMFELTNGFRKAIYWSKEQMEAHALTYSPGYKAKKGYTFWEKNFDAMAYKTMLRQLISKWGIMSIDMRAAFDGDMAVINEDGTKEYVENDDSVIDMEQQQEVSQQMQSEISETIQQPTDAQMALFGNN